MTGATDSRMDGGQSPADLDLEQQRAKRRRARSIAIALALGFLVILFYAATIVRMGPDVLNRPL